MCICVSLGLYQWSESVIRMVSRLWDVRGGLMVRHQVRVLVTPRVVVSCDSNWKHIFFFPSFVSADKSFTSCIPALHLQEEARRHFDCPILEGMELENQGGTGTELNHWEKRLLEVEFYTILSNPLLMVGVFFYLKYKIFFFVFQNEAMTGSHTQNRVFSRLTLAIMEDSGWYRANYSMAQKLDWGRGLGCDFVMKSCKFWMDKQRQR